MRIKRFIIIFLLHMSLFSMDNIPGIKQIVSGARKVGNAFKELTESSSTEHSSGSDQEPQLTSSTSSILSEEDTLRISGILQELGVDPINHYERALHAILDNNRTDFLDALSKLPKKNLELKERLQWYWEIYKEGKELKKGIMVQAKHENDVLLAKEIFQAAQEIQAEIEQAPFVITPVNKRRLKLPSLDFSVFSPKNLTEPEQESASEISPSQQTIIKTVSINSESPHHTQFEKEKAHHYSIKKDKKLDNP